MKYINKLSNRKKVSIKKIIEKRFYILIALIMIIGITLIIGLFNVQIVKHTYYLKQVELASQNIIDGDTAPRGRIYDRHHRLIVDNKPVKIIYYKKIIGTTKQDELLLAYKVARILDIDPSSLNDRNLKLFWLYTHPDEAEKKITSEEREKYRNRQLTINDLDQLKIDRVTEEELKQYGIEDYKAAYIYYLMNKGYSYDEKIIKRENVTDKEYAIIAEESEQLKGFNVKLDWERYYPYNDTFKTILGTISKGLPYELKDYYLTKGYALDDRVGLNYLEYQYEDLLRGTKEKYEILDDGNLKKVGDGQRGKDLVLTIDIELQQAVEQIIVEQLLLAKKEPNTEYLNHAYVIIANPNTGEILAMAGKQVVKKGNEYVVYDYTPGIVTSPLPVGSAVKGASHIVGYNAGALTIGEYRKDDCIKIAGTPEKCSWRKLGRINDLEALRYSSNVYQFLTAIKVGKGTYRYNAAVTIDPNAFEIYRQTFKEFGLGVKTGIDLPVESLGYVGTSTHTGHLLDFAIGQYDTYTPIQLSQYINTIANGGKRIRPFLLKEVYEPTPEPLTEMILQTETEVLNTITTKPEYLERIKLGFKEVMRSGGTGYTYIDDIYKPAGKTGTSESFIDTDHDGKIDKQTLSNTFVAYAPYDNPIVTFTVVSPNVGHYYNGNNYRSRVNRKISYEVSKKFFEIYQ